MVVKEKQLLQILISTCTELLSFKNIFQLRSTTDVQGHFKNGLEVSLLVILILVRVNYIINSISIIFETYVLHKFIYWNPSTLTAFKILQPTTAD